MLRYVVMPVALALLACGPLPGDRGGTSGGGCPPGEICSPQAPNGLFFEGETLSSHLFDVGDHPTAVGGQQHYSIFQSEDREPILVPFSVEIQGPAEVVSTTAATVTVLASAAGSFQLRVLDQGGALLDSITLPAAEIESASILPTAGARFGGPFNNDEAPLYFDGETITLVLGLQSSSLQALVDNQATAAMGTRGRWDLYENVVATAATIDVTAAGVDFTTPLETVSSIDRVSVTTSNEARIEIAPNSSVKPCFAAHAGTRLVYGVPWAFSLAGEGLTLEGVQLERCADVTSNDAPGLGTLTVGAGDRQQDFTIDITAGNRAPAPLIVGDEHEQWQPMSGDRAAAHGASLEDVL